MIQSAERVRLAHRRWLAPVCLMAVATTAAPAAAQDTVVSAGLTVRFISGSFGSDQTTRLVYAPAVLRVDAGRFEMSGYFPYLTCTSAIRQKPICEMRFSGASAGGDG